MKRILFVDDEQRVLDGLQRMLHSFRREWTMTFVSSGPEALAMLAQNPYDVIVTDIRMPGIGGVSLLTQVMEQYPQMVRMILSGQADQESGMQTARVAHQYLAKPCDAASLRSAVDRAFRLRSLLDDPSLKRLIARMTSLPSLPSLYMELMQALRSPDVSSQQIGAIIAKDMGMTAKVLQLINSAFFGVRRHIANPVEAVTYLGIDTIKALSFSIKIFSQFNASRSPHFSMETLWKHSLNVGTAAQRIAQSQSVPKKTTDEALMAGLLHDVGKLVLATNCPELYGKALQLVRMKKITEREAEREIFGATHTEVGTYLLWLWGLPDAITDAVAFHHNPDQCAPLTFGPLTAVHVANGLEHEKSARSPEEAASPVDMQYLAKLGLEPQLPKWRAILQGMTAGGEGR